VSNVRVRDLSAGSRQLASYRTLRGALRTLPIGQVALVVFDDPVLVETGAAHHHIDVFSQAVEPFLPVGVSASVADTIGASWVAVERYAGKGVWWTGEPVVAFATARKVNEEWAANQEAAAETQRQYDAEQEAKIERERAEYARERERQAQPGRLLHGVRLTRPPESEQTEWAQ
jgi:hypothetical protein